MIVRDHLPLHQIWPHVSKRLGLIFLYDILICVLYVHFGFTSLGLSTLPLAMIGGALSIFLAFRNNSAYDRWWEARTLWGGLVNTSRTFSRQALTLIDPPHRGDGVTREMLVELQISYVHALRCHLRKQNSFPEIESRLPAEWIQYLREQRNVPIAILMLKGQALRQLFDLGRMDTFRFMSMDQTLGELCNIQGACERIKNTPLPRQYHHVPRMLVAFYTILLPLGLVDGLGLLTPIASTLISFMFLSLETIGQDIENPFENSVHDTPMSSLSRTIEVNLRQNLEEKTLPPDIRPVDGFVY